MAVTPNPRRIFAASAASEQHLTLENSLEPIPGFPPRRRPMYEMAGSGRCDPRQRGFGGWPPCSSGRLLGLDLKVLPRYTRGGENLRVLPAVRAFIWPHSSYSSLPPPVTALKPSTRGSQARGTASQGTAPASLPSKSASVTKNDVTCDAFKLSVALVGVRVPFFLEFDAGLSQLPPCVTSIRVASVSYSKL